MSKEKTVLSELVEWCDSFKNPQFQPTPLNLKEKILTLLQRERQDLIDAWTNRRLNPNEAWNRTEKVKNKLFEQADNYVKEKYGI